MVGLSGFCSEYAGALSLTNVYKEFSVRLSEIQRINHFLNSAGDDPPRDRTSGLGTTIGARTNDDWILP